MSKNPYVQKFSKAFNIGLGIVIFAFLVGLALIPQNAKAVTEGSMPAICFNEEEFVVEYQSKTFEIVGKSNVVAFLRGKPYNVIKLTTVDQNGKVGTWITDSSKQFCLLFLENSGNLVSQ